MPDRQPTDGRPAALDEVSGQPAGNDDGTARMSDQTVEWTDADRAMWRQAHEPWWTQPGDGQPSAQ